MSEPSGFPLNGCDAFMLAMDGAMRREGGPPNICHLLISLESNTEILSLLNHLTNHPTMRAVSRLRLATPFLRTPHWIATGEDVPQIPLFDSCRTESELQQLILAHSFDPKRSAPFGVIALPSFAEGPSLLFFWHHALCDAHGGEALVKEVSSSPSGALPLMPSPMIPIARKEAAQRAHRTKRLIFKKASGPLVRLTPRHPDTRRHAYARLSFSQEQTTAVDTKVRDLTGGMFPTALYLAATARALSRTLDLPDSSKHSLFVPVPHDMRRMTKQRSPLSNQVSVAFFRLTPRYTLPLLDSTNEVIEQLHETIAEQHHRGMLDFLRFTRRLPSRLLWRVIERPTRGHPASFYFSDIGSSLSTIEEIHGARVKDASHYPPNLAPPGFTTVWSRYRGRLELRLCYDQASLSQESLKSFMKHLQQDLFGSAA